MRAKIIDPVGPRWVHALPYLAAALFVVAACAQPLGTRALVLAAASAFFLAPWMTGRRRPRDVELALCPGKVQVRGAGLLSQTLDARAIRGASTARLEDGVGLAVMREERDRATHLVVASDGDAHAIREALGVGHSGFGELSWVLAPPPGMKIERVGRLLAWAGFVGATVGGAFGLDPVLYLLSTLAVLGTLATFLGYVARARPPRVFLRPDGVHVYASGWSHFAYASIAGVHAAGGSLCIAVHGQTAPVVVPLGMSRATASGASAPEVAQLIAQMVSAAQRAQGKAPEKRVAATRIDLLARGADGHEAWLARLDATAAMFVADRGYRSAGLDEQDLWATLRDPEAPADLRAGAARILVRVAPEEARAEVAAVLAAVRAQADEELIRAALPPPRALEIEADAEEVGHQNRA